MVLESPILVINRRYLTLAKRQLYIHVFHGKLLKAPKNGALKSLTPKFIYI